jgi:hypothetical protein
MMSMHRTLPASLLLLITATGCFTETRTYSMSVRNQLATPVSVCVTKDYGPEEPLWESPEEMIEPPHPATDQTPPGKVIPPGKTLTAPPFTGKFDPDRGRAYLRIYYGTPTLTQMNAIDAGNPDRLDVPLDEGFNRIEIKPGEGGKMTAERVIGPWPATQPGSP